MQTQPINSNTILQLKLKHSTFHRNFLFLSVFVGLRLILWGHWYPLFRTSDDSAAHGFQNQGGIIIALVSHAMIPRVISGCRDHGSNLDCTLVRQA